MFALPGVNEETTPVVAFTEATDGSLLDHAPVPPPSTTPLAVKIEVEPTHAEEGPVTDDTALPEVTVMVPVALTLTQPPTRGML
jgi:hypothetical protein